MQYTEEELSKIHEYASYLMSIAEIAILLNCDEDELRSKIFDKTTEVSRSYNMGKTKTILDLHKQEIELAKLGSPLSIELTQSYIINQRISE